MDNKRKLILAIAVILAITAGFSFVKYISSLDNRVPVVVSTQEIEAGTILSSNMLTTIMVHPDAVTDDSFINPQELLDKEVVTYIGKGEQMVSYRLSGSERVSGSVSDNLPVDKIALGIPTTLTYSVGGQIEQLDKVIINGIDPNSDIAVTLARDVSIIKILDKSGSEITREQAKSKSSNEEPVVVVVELNEEEMSVVATYMNLGPIILALQNKE